MPAWLVESSGEHAGRMHEVEPDTPTTIGRALDNTIVVPHANTSRRHARVSFDGERWLVEDLGTVNGTLKGRQRIAGPEPLHDGDQISVPGLTLTFQVTDATVAIRIGPDSRASTTKSFLFADLREYTSFVEKHGDGAANEVIAQYRQLVRNEVRRAGGHEIKTEGDSFFVVFDSAFQAIGCAIGVQRAAADHTALNADRPIRVGIGVHAGEPTVQGDQYVGIAVNIAARLAQNAAAGEILISDIVRGLVRGSPHLSMAEREGLTLKGIEDAPRIYAVAPAEAVA